MIKRTFVTLTALMTILWSVTCAAAEKTNNWLVYWYICGSNLERNSHSATRNIADMQNVNLPSNVNVLIYAGGLKSPESDIKEWHHPTLKEGGDGIYLYSSNRLEKLESQENNMGDPDTLESFLEFGEENIRFGKENVEADHRIIIFSNHGGLGGVCYDDNFNGDGLTYNELKSALSNVYGTSPETVPFELIGFDACMTGSYELANSISDFSRYMLGSEPNSNSLDFKSLFSALAKNSSINGAQIGKTICDKTMEWYKKEWLKGDLKQYDNALSVIDLTKMPKLREAYEEYFDETLKRSDEDEGFIGAFARAAESRNADRFSNLYTDLGLLAENTKSIMPEPSKKLIKAIDESVVYNKRGDYLKSKGMSTYYPYISLETTPEKALDSTKNGFNQIKNQNATYASQKDFYQKLLNAKKLPDMMEIQLNKNSSGHFVANFTPEQMKNISNVRCVLIPLKESIDSGFLNSGLDVGGAILTSDDAFKVDWKKGTVTEDFRPIEPVFDDHKIVLLPLSSGRGHTFYKVPIIYNDWRYDLIVRYDTSAKKYSIIGFGSVVENGVVRTLNGQPEHGFVITTLNLVASFDGSDEPMGIIGNKHIKKDDGQIEKVHVYASSIFSKYTDPKTGKTTYYKWVKGTPFVYTRDSAITNKQITKGTYLYVFSFGSPSSYGVVSQPGFIHIERGKVSRFSLDEINAENNE